MMRRYRARRDRRSAQRERIHEAYRRLLAPEPSENILALTADKRKDMFA